MGMPTMIRFDASHRVSRLSSVNGETQRIGPEATVVDGGANVSAVCSDGVVPEVASAKMVLAGEIVMVGTGGMAAAPGGAAWACAVIAQQAISAPTIFAAVL